MDRCIRSLVPVLLILFSGVVRLPAAKTGGVIDFTKDETLNAVYAAGYVPYFQDANRFVLVLQDCSIKISDNITIKMFAEDVTFSFLNDYRMSGVDFMSDPGKRDDVVVQAREILKSIGYTGTDFDDFLKNPITILGDNEYWPYDLFLGNINVHVDFNQALTPDGIVSSIYVFVSWDRPYDRHNAIGLINHPPPAYASVPLEKVPTIGPRPDPLTGYYTIEEKMAHRGDTRRHVAIDSFASPAVVWSLLAVFGAFAALAICRYGWHSHTRNR